MNRRKLMKHLRRHGCILVREGRAHSIVARPAANTQTQVPRHPEVATPTAWRICKQLGVPLPSER